MGEANARGTREARLAAALEREETRRREWAEEMVADAAALIEAARRHIRARDSVPDGGTLTVGQASDADYLAKLAASRAVATDLLDALAPGDESELEDEEPPERPAPAKAPFSLVTPSPAKPG